ncbi:CPBP family intramembrane metalloprotease [Thalassomonas viridans]|uniref:CPBP family intramembrane metalloprotease n=1 Tax=Thalassomonas viridans TaxID=137584 RepID=A0AAE9Z2C7_9GAMM|nr:CPBP family intramembrane glutamic endopeptidase [Thalassomonas viridans]WDE05298.1 CPBP family intramembrane metalloprotease [Thalassomonas viridans]
MKLKLFFGLMFCGLSCAWGGGSELSSGQTGYFQTPAADLFTTDNANVAAMSGLLLPGSVQFFDGNFLTGLSYGGTALAGMALYGHYSDKDDYFEDDDELFSDALKESYINKTTFNADMAQTVFLNTMFASSYDAYKRKSRHRQFNHGVIAPGEDIKDLWQAPFKFEQLSKPSTYVPLLLFAAYVSSRDNVYAIRRSGDISSGTLYAGNFAGNLFTGVGEEAFFRGYVNTELSHQLGENLGLAASSVLFGAMHSGDGNQASFGEAAVIGGYLGWLHQKNNYNLSQGVALHYWFNVIAGLAELHHGGQVPIFQYSVEF